MLQPGAGHVRVDENQGAQALEPGEFLQTVIRNLGVRQFDGDDTDAGGFEFVSDFATELLDERCRLEIAKTGPSRARQGEAQEQREQREEDGRSGGHDELPADVSGAGRPYYLPSGRYKMTASLANNFSCAGES